MIALHTRSRCDECDKIASVEVEPDCFLCDDCVAIVCAVLSNSVSDGTAALPVSPFTEAAGPGEVSPSEFSSGDGLGNQQPGSNTWGGGNATAPSGRARDRAKCPAVTGSHLDFESEVSALEAEWAARGIIMNASTLRTVADNRSVSKSVSVTE